MIIERARGKKKLYLYLLTAIGLCAAIAVIILNTASLLSPGPPGSAKSSFRGVLSGALMGIVFILLSFQSYLQVQNNENPKPSPFVSPYALAVFLLLAGLFSLATGLFTAYMKTGR